MKFHIGQNLSLIFLSLILAFFFWAVATETEDPMEERTLTGLAIEFRGIPEGMKAYGAEGVKARVLLRAPQSLRDVLEPEDMRVYVDFSQVTPGQNLVLPAQIELRRRPVQVVEYSPLELVLNLEPVGERDVPVAVVVQGLPALGFAARSPVYVPRTVTVSGPETLIAQVSRALITAPVEDKRQNVTGDFAPTPVDETGAVVPYVQIVPKTVTVQVPIEQRTNFSDAAVRVVLSGQPAPGYRVGRVAVEPPVVTVFGSREALQALTAPLETEPVPLNAASAHFTATAALRVPDGLSVLYTPQVLVTVEIETVESEMTVQITPELQGLGPQLTATLTLPELQIILIGPFNVIRDFDPAPIRVILNVADKGPGEHTLPVEVLLPDVGLLVKEILPQSSVVVKIEELPTP